MTEEMTNKYPAALGTNNHYSLYIYNTIVNKTQTNKVPMQQLLNLIRKNSLKNVFL